MFYKFSDADYARNLDVQTSIGAYLFYFGQTSISWNSKKQNSTIRLSRKSEYRALAKCACEVI